MKVYFVGGGPGDPELLTRKAERLLRNCRCCIYAGSLVSPDVLNLIPEEAEKYDSAGLSLEKIISICLEAKEKGCDVIRLHSGDPSIYGAIGEQMNELDRAGIEYEVIPGVSSFQAAAAALKTELTAPEISQTIILTRTSGRTPLPKEQELASLARSKATLCIFLSVDQMESIASTLIPHYGATCPAAVIYRASWPDQKLIKGTLEDLPAKVVAEGIRKTAMILIGPALGRGLTASKLYDREFSHGYRQGEEK
jgi:precorrin-4/cobalt-precorrin-4 C11-methyltransferase